MSPNDLVAIPGGEFLMGQENGRDEERPVHRVTVAPFRLCRFQVTNADFAAFRQFAFDDPALARDLGELVRRRRVLRMAVARSGASPCVCRPRPSGSSPPAAASSRSCIRGATRPSPTRADYAARWREGPEPVATSEPNGYGLFDMCENVHEWCSDWYDPRYYDVSPV